MFVSLLLHGVWEYMHIPMYTGYESLASYPTIVVFAIAGDVLYTVISVALVGLFKKRHDWFVEAHPFDFLGLAVVGGFIALEVEYRALFLNRWEYLASMPILPIFAVGLSPVLQMLILLPLTVLITREFLKRY
jgi:predicted membrane protein